MITCPKCGEQTGERALRCEHCDAWLVNYEFKKPSRGKSEKRKKKSVTKSSHDDVFLPDDLVDTVNDAEPEKEVERIMLMGNPSGEEVIPSPNDAEFKNIFNPKCPGCGGDVKPYEVRCRSCGLLLKDKIEQSKKLKPYWEQIFRDKVLQDGEYGDIYSNGDVKFLYKKLLNRGNKLIIYLFSALALLVFAGLFLMYCVGTYFN